MTTAKQLKARVRARMARTGERYAVARAHVVDGAVDPGPIVDLGWALRGGIDPDTAALANVLAHRGVTGPDGPLTELLFLVGGGLGAGYILWDSDDDSRVVTSGSPTPGSTSTGGWPRRSTGWAWTSPGRAPAAPRPRRRRWPRRWPPAIRRSSGRTATTWATGTCRRSSTDRVAIRSSSTPSWGAGLRRRAARWRR